MILSHYKQQASPNVGGVLKAKLVVMHYTASSSGAGSIAWLCTPASKVSAHFVVDRDGSVTQLVDTARVAWHAGASVWTCQDGTKLISLNNSSIGVELVNLGHVAHGGVPAKHKNDGLPRRWEVYPQAQLASAAKLVSELQQLGCVSSNEIVGHDDIAPSRKLDPGPLFDMVGFRLRAAELRG